LTVYLTDEPFADIAMAYAAQDPTARVVLLQDAVYLARRGSLKGEIYVIGDDVTRRGLSDFISSAVHVIGYDGLVDLMERDRVVNFL
jgi:sulfur relay protein TusB/DsrH